MRYIPAVMIALAGVAALPTALLAQGFVATVPPAKPETQAQLQKEAKITLATATLTALKEVPGGKVAEHELEREHGKLIYSFDIAVAGKTGSEEVNVDAVTGAMVAHVHEESQAELQKKAKVSLAAATLTALKEVPGGKVAEHELEWENGRLIYSFDIKVAGKAGTEEVNIDAITGALVDHTHESE